MTPPTLAEFFMLCDMQHREFYSAMLHDWSGTGLPWEWRDQDIALCMHATGRSITLFILSAGHDMNPPLIRLAHDEIRSALGQEEADSLKRYIKDIHGLKCREQLDRFEVVEPGDASGPVQQALRDVVRGIGVRLPNLLAP